MTLPYFLLLLACISFVLATFNVSHPRVNFVGLGLALWTLSLLIPLFH